MLDKNEHLLPLMSSCQKMNKDSFLTKAFTRVWLVVSCISLPITTKLLFCGLCDLYQSNPKVMYLTWVKHIIKYINAISYYGILYSFDTNSSLICCDVVGERNVEDRKKTFGEFFFFGNNLIFWFSKKKNCVSTIVIRSSQTQLL